MFSSLTHHCIVFNSCNGLIKQQIHYCFKIFIIADVFLHDGDNISVSQQLIFFIELLEAQTLLLLLHLLFIIFTKKDNFILI